VTGGDAPDPTAPAGDAPGPDTAGPATATAAPPAPDKPGPPSRRGRVSRRRLLGGAGLAGVAGAVGVGATLGVEQLTDDGPDPMSNARTAAQAAVRPTGPRQPGIAERAPANLLFTAYDLPAGSPVAVRNTLRATLRAWTPAIAALMAGDRRADPDGSATGLGPAALTVTVGLGASALRGAGLIAAIPAELADLPRFSTDQLQPARSGGDLSVQVCAEDPMVAFAAARTLARLAPNLSPRWTQRGFLRTAAAADAPNATPRNLMGQVDGTDNPLPGTPQFDYAVWTPRGPAWMTGGTYLVCRRIRMKLDSWDRLATSGKEKVIGRRLSDGAPLSAPPGASEDTVPDFSAIAPNGARAIAANAHVRLSHPLLHGGIAMFRRGFSYDDGLDAAGEPDAGLFFQAYQADPRTAFVPVQRTLAASDALNAFIEHTSSALFAIPPVTPGGYLGQPLLEE